METYTNPVSKPELVMLAKPPAKIFEGISPKFSVVGKRQKTRLRFLSDPEPRLFLEF